MVKSWREDYLEQENTDLRIRLKACLDLIEEISQFETGLFQEKRSKEFVMRYVRTVTKAKRLLKKLMPNDGPLV